MSIARQVISTFFLRSSGFEKWNNEKSCIKKILWAIIIPKLHFFIFLINVCLSLFAFRSLNGKLVVSILCLFWSWRLLYLLLTPMLVSYYQNHNIFILWGWQIEWYVPCNYFSIRFSVGFCVKFRVEFHVGFCVGSFSSNHSS